MTLLTSGVWMLLPVQPASDTGHTGGDSVGVRLVPSRSSAVKIEIKSNVIYRVFLLTVTN